MPDLDITLDTRARHTLSRQLYEELRRLIVTGKIAPSQPLPATRALSAELGIARATVVAAFNRLKQEGYVEGLDGSGTYVSNNLPEQPAKPIAEKETPLQIQVKRARLSTYAKHVLNFPGIEYSWTEPEISFHGWRGALSVAPVRQLSQAFARAAKKFDPALLDYAHEPLGYKPLREAIARWLRKTRGIKCSEDQVIVLCGWRQAISLMARIHLDRGDLVAIENPSYPGLRESFELEGATVFSVPVDESGFLVDEVIESVDEQFRLVYLSPSHQNPIGVALSLNRRVELLNWARRSGALIVEDEHDSEFQFGVGSIPALKGLDEQNQVIFLGSFYKTLFPSLGIAYLVLPDNLVEVYCRTRDFVGEHVPLLLQAMLADFMQRGYLLRHVRKMHVLYAKRRQALMRSLEKHFGPRATVFGEEAGMHALVQFETGLSETEIIYKAKTVGVGLVGTSRYYVGGPVHQAEFMLGYADLTEQRIEEGIKRLASILL